MYKFRKIFGKYDFPYQFKKIIVRYKKIGNFIGDLRQTACLVVNPIKVNSRPKAVRRFFCFWFFGDFRCHVL